jgi:hypothetical protein
MKLTKGKLAKIINKKRQSLKRNKKNAKKNNNKTFRKRKHVNLHSRSLKKYSGGLVEAKEPDNKEAELDPTSSDYENPSKLEIVNQEQPVDKKEETLKEVVPVTKMMDEMDESAISGESEPEKEQEIPGESEPEKEQEIPGESEPEKEQVQTLPEEPLESVEPEIQPKTEESSEYGSDDGLEDEQPSVEDSLEKEQPITLEEPSQRTSPVESDVSIVAESLDKLVEYISDKIAKKLKTVSFAPSNELNKDSFDALANANQSLVDA